MIFSRFPKMPATLEAGQAPKVLLEATHAATLEFVSLADLEAHSAE